MCNLRGAVAFCPPRICPDAGAVAYCLGGVSKP